jgi:hypothetical protein
MYPATVFSVIVLMLSSGTIAWGESPRLELFKSAFHRRALLLSDSEIQRIFPSLQIAYRDQCAQRAPGVPNGINSKVRFASVQIAHQLGFDTKRDPSVADRIAETVASIPCEGARPWCGVEEATSRPPDLSWNEYFERTLNLSSEPNFLRLVRERGFSPVKISWEDIGRYAGSVWGDRISDVGIWVREREGDPASAKLALSVRRDENFRDKVLMVPTDKIKLHRREAGRMTEQSLLDRLRELNLTSETRDDLVIVSNQFSIVPVPLPGMKTGSTCCEPPRTAFTFSIFPYGSTNFVITDVIEGSHEAVVGAGSHQLLFANKDGERAPFTASRASDRQDLVALERDLKGQGLDVDLQRYYLIQIPLKRNAQGVELSNMGTPPLGRAEFLPQNELSVAESATFGKSSDALRSGAAPGMERVAIGTGAAEGRYHGGSGFRGQRAEEPIRVTVVYFVTPRGPVTEADMRSFSAAFERWDEKAVWGGSFVTQKGEG